MKLKKYPHKFLLDFVLKRGIYTKLSTYPHIKLSIIVDNLSLFLSFFHRVFLTSFAHILSPLYPPFKSAKFYLYKHISHNFFYLIPKFTQPTKTTKFYLLKERY